MHDPARKPANLAWLYACLAILAGMVVAMKLEGRVWISASGLVRPWWSDVWSSECSQQLADPYSITHVSHGFFFAGLFTLLGRPLARRGWGWAADPRWHAAAAVFIAAAWEVLENSEFIINRYRTVTMSLDYLGDSVLNAVGDVLSCALGFVLARRLGFWKTFALFIATELVLLWLIRDNLTLNVIMLIHPVESIKTWQSVNAPK